MPEGNATLKEIGIVAHPLHEIEEMHACLDLQRSIWGDSETDVVPEAMFVVAEHSGGQVLGATHEDKLVGFAFSFAGRRAGVEYLHSHMVEVAPEYQNRGIGRLLKLAQRQDALERGIKLIEWTFDPLRLKNAHFNIVRLGVIVRRYIPNCCGRTSRPSHAGLPTDRLVAEWWLESKRVKDTLKGKCAPAGPRQTRVSVPADIHQISSSDPQRAETIQFAIRKQFEIGFARAQAAVGFELDRDRGSYVLEPYEN